MGEFIRDEGLDADPVRAYSWASRVLRPVMYRVSYMFNCLRTLLSIKYSTFVWGASTVFYLLPPFCHVH